jgi:hypothetical protein
LKRLLAAVLSVLIGAGIVAGTALWASSAGAEPPTLVARFDGEKQTPDGRTLPHHLLDMAVYPGAAVGPDGKADGPDANWPFFSPSTSLQVPANSLVTIRLKMYDGGTPPYNEFFGRVHGTVDGTISIDGEVHEAVKLENVAHTFTIHQFPEANQPDFFVSVPFKGVPAKAPNLENGYPKPVVTEFTFETGEPGSYIWNCEVPCGDRYMWFGGPMQERGFMAGTFEVVG